MSRGETEFGAEGPEGVVAVVSDAALRLTILLLSQAQGLRLHYWEGGVAGALAGLAQMDRLASAVFVTAVICCCCFVLSRTTGNCSWVDRLWSVTPAFFTLWFTFLPLVAPSPRSVVMCCLAVAWSLRLTYNFARKGGYSPHDEDYRWPVLRRTIPPAAFVLFDLLFISSYQNVLLLWLASPAYVASSHLALPWGPVDWLALSLWLLLWTGEIIADQQQWNFQTDKSVSSIHPSIHPSGKMCFFSQKNCN